MTRRDLRVAVLMEALRRERGAHLALLETSRDACASRAEVIGALWRAARSTDVLRGAAGQLAKTFDGWLEPRIRQLLERCPDLSHVELVGETVAFEAPGLDIVHPEEDHKDFAAVLELVQSLPAGAWWTLLCRDRGALATARGDRIESWCITRLGVSSGDWAGPIELTDYELELAAAAP